MSQQQAGFGRGFTGSSSTATLPRAPSQKLVFRANVEMYFSINKGGNPSLAEKPLTMVASMIEEIMKKAKMDTKDGVIELLGFNKTEIDQQS